MNYLTGDDFEFIDEEPSRDQFLDGLFQWDQPAPPSTPLAPVPDDVEYIDDSPAFQDLQVPYRPPEQLEPMFFPRNIVDQTPTPQSDTYGMTPNQRYAHTEKLREQLTRWDRNDGRQYGDESLNVIDRMGLGFRQGAESINASLGGILQAMPEWGRGASRDTGQEMSRAANQESRELANLGESDTSTPIGDFTQWISGAAVSLLPTIPAAILGGPGAAAWVAGSQSFGSTYADAVEAYSKEMPLEEARQKAYAPAAVSGLITGLLTKYMPGGPEHISAAAIKQMGVKTLQQAAKAIRKDVTLEATEEWWDQVGQGIVKKYSYAPETTWLQIGQEAALAWLAGGILSGAIKSSTEALGQILNLNRPPISNAQMPLPPASQQGMPVPPVIPPPIPTAQVAAQVATPPAAAATPPATPAGPSQAARDRAKVVARKILIGRGVDPDTADFFSNTFVDITQADASQAEAFRDQLNQAFDASGLLSPREANRRGALEKLIAEAKAEGSWTPEQIAQMPAIRAAEDQRIIEHNRQNIQRAIRGEAPIPLESLAEVDKRAKAEQAAAEAEALAAQPAPAVALTETAADVWALYFQVSKRYNAATDQKERSALFKELQVLEEKAFSLEQREAAAVVPPAPPVQPSVPTPPSAPALPQALVTPEMVQPPPPAFVPKTIEPAIVPPVAPPIPAERPMPEGQALDEMIQLLQDTIATKVANGDKVPEPYRKRLGELQAKKRGENIAPGTKVYVDENTPSHPSNSENPILPYYFEASIEGYRSLKDRSREAEARYVAATKKIPQAKGVNKTELEIERGNMNAVLKQLGRISRQIAEKLGMTEEQMDSALAADPAPAVPPVVKDSLTPEAPVPVPVGRKRPKKAAAVAPEPLPEPPAPKPVKPPKVAKGVKKARVMREIEREEELLPDSDKFRDIIEWLRKGGGRLMSKKTFKRLKKIDSGSYDGIEGYKLPIHHNLAIYKKDGGQTPDDLIAEALSRGFIKEANEGALWEAIKEASERRRALTDPATGKAKQDAKEGRWLDEMEAELIEWQKATANAAMEVALGDLEVGDVMDVEGERVEVTAVDPETGEVSLKDGTRFGRQTMPSGATIWVESLTRTADTIDETGLEDADWNPEGDEAAEPTVAENATVPPKLRPGEVEGDLLQGKDAPFNLAGETADDPVRVAREEAEAMVERLRKMEAQAKAEKQQQDLFRGQLGVPNQRINNTPFMLDSLVELRKPQPYGLTPAKDGTISTQSFAAKLKAQSGGEYEYLNGLPDGRRLDDFVRQNPRATVAQLQDWLESKQPGLVVVELKAEGDVSEYQKELAELQHQLDSMPPISDLNDEQYEEWTKIRDRMDELNRFIRSDKGKSNESATARFTQVNPKPLDQMPGAVDLVLRGPSGGIYKEPHFQDSGSDALGHVRGYFETGPNGEKIFHVFELQSQWAQDAKKHGVKSASSDNELKALLKASDDARAAYKALGASDVPERRILGDVVRETQKAYQSYYSKIQSQPRDHPLLDFTDNLLVKTAVDYALKNGATHIALSDGKTALMTEGHENSKALLSMLGLKGVTPENLPALQQELEDRGINSYTTKDKDWEEVGLDKPGMTWTVTLSAGNNLEPKVLTDDELKFLKEAGFRVKTEGGMLQSYDRALPNALEKLTESKPTEASFGTHKNGPSRWFDNKPDITARVYALDRVKAKMERQGGLRLFNRQGQIGATSAQGTVQPKSATGAAAVRALVNDPANGLPTRTIQVINALLDSPALRDTGIAERLTVTLGDAGQGFLASVEGNEITLSSEADAKSFPHEISHILKTILPQKYQDSIERFRQEALRAMFGDNIPSALASGTMTSKEFQDSGLPPEAYMLINADEFLAKFVGEKFAADHFTNRNGDRAIWKKVQDWFKGLWDALQRVLGVNPSIERVYREMLAGVHKLNPEDGALVEEKRGQYVKNRKRADDSLAAQKTFGPDALAFQRDAIHAQTTPLIELIAPKVAGANSVVQKLTGLPALRDIAGAVTGKPVQTYAQIAAGYVGSALKNVLGLEVSSKISVLKHLWKATRKEFEKVQKKVNGPQFQNNWHVRLPALDFEKNRLAQAMRDYEAFVKDAIQKATSQIAVGGATAAAAQARLNQMNFAAAHLSAIEQAVVDIINIMEGDTTGAGMQLLFRGGLPTGPDIVAHYNPLKTAAIAAGGNPAFNHDIVDLAAELLAHGRKVTQQLVANRLIQTSPGFRGAFTAAANQVVVGMKNNPQATLATIMRKHAGSVRAQISAMEAWRALNQVVTDQLQDLRDLQDAVTAIDAILADPNFIETTNLAAADGKVEVRPDGTATVDGKEITLASLEYERAQGQIMIPLPGGGIETVNLAAEDYTPERAKLDAARNVLSAWISTQDALPPEQRDPGYQFFNNHLEALDKLYRTMGVNNPDTIVPLLARPMGMVQFAFENVGDRLSVVTQKFAGLFAKSNKRAEQMKRDFQNKIAVAGTAAAKAYGFTKDRDNSEARIFLYDEVLRPLFKLAQVQGLEVRAGMVVGKGYEVKLEALTVMRLQSEAAKRGYDILQETLPNEQPGVAFAPVIENIIDGARVFGQSIRTGRYTLPGGHNGKAKDFVTGFLDPKRTQAQREADLEDNWDLIFAYIGDRSSIREFGASPYESAYASVVADLQARFQAGTLATTNQTLDFVADLVANQVLEPTATVKAAMVKELTDLIKLFGVSADIPAQPSASTTTTPNRANSFTKRRNDIVFPYYFMQYGFRASPDFMGFAFDIHTVTFAKLDEGLREMLIVLKRQLADLNNKVGVQARKLGITDQESKDRILTQNARDRIDGKTYTRLADLQFNIDKITKLLEDNRLVWVEGKNENLMTGPGSRFLGQQISQMVTGIGTLISNIFSVPIVTGITISYQRNIVMATGKSLVDWIMAIGATTVPVVWHTVKGAGKAVGKGAAHLVSPKGQPRSYALPIALAQIAHEIGDRSLRWGQTMRGLADRGAFAVEDYEAEMIAKWNDLPTMGMTLEKNWGPVTNTLYSAMGLFDFLVYTPFLKPLLPTFGDRITNNYAASQVNTTMRDLGRELKGMFKVYEKTGKLATRFNFTDLNAAQNRIVPDEWFRNAFFKSNPHRKLAQLERLFNDAGMDLNLEAMRYLAQLQAGDPDARFLDPNALLNLQEQLLNNVNIATAINRPVQFKTQSTARLIGTLQGWNIYTFRNLLGTMLARPGISPGQKKYWLWVVAAAAVLPAVMALSATVSKPIEEELLRILWRLIFGAERNTRQPWERDGTASQAIGHALNALAVFPFVSMAANAALNDLPGKASLDPTPILINKLKDVARYVGGVAQTGDVAFGFPELVRSFMPLSPAVLNRLDSQEGLVEERNALALLRRYGPVDMLKPRAAMAGTATPLTPIIRQMENAAFAGDLAKFQELKAQAEAKAVEMGRDPATVKQSFEARNPYSKVFNGKLTEEQRATILGKMSDSERQILSNAESRFSAAAETWGGKPKSYAMTSAQAQKKQTKLEAARMGLPAPKASSAGYYTRATDRAQNTRPVVGATRRPSASLASLSRLRARTKRVGRVRSSRIGRRRTSRIRRTRRVRAI